MGPLGRGDNPEMREQADYLLGWTHCLAALGHPSPLMEAAEATVRKAARQTCGKGYMGCYGGPDCTSDHK